MDINARRSRLCNYNAGTSEQLRPLGSLMHGVHEHASVHSAAISIQRHFRAPIELQRNGATSNLYSTQASTVGSDQRPLLYGAAGERAGTDLQRLRNANSTVTRGKLEQGNITCESGNRGHR